MNLITSYCIVVNENKLRSLFTGEHFYRHKRLTILISSGNSQEAPSVQ